MSSEVRGLQQLAAAFRRDAAKKAAGAERGLKKAIKVLFRASQALVPVDQGPLKASGDIREEGSGFDTVVRVVYTAGYAMYVHENMDAVHGELYNEKYAHQIANKLIDSRTGAPYHDRKPAQQAKFLEDPYMELLPELKRIILAEIMR